MENIKERMVSEKWFAAPESLYIADNDKATDFLQINHSIVPKYRSVFDRDRDRILYSKAFRRLNGKSQIFIPRTHDYVRTRLTHSLEVNQIGRSIGKGLGLNLSLIEAIALGHDAGHTPFGHAGEYELNLIMNNCAKITMSNIEELPNTEKGFKHNLQSVRSFLKLSSLYGTSGIQLSPFTFWGILNHTKLKYKECDYCKGHMCKRYNGVSKCINKNELKVEYYNSWVKEATKINQVDAWCLEGIVIAIADEIAQIHHDVEDSIFMGIITLNEAKELLHQFIDPAIKQCPELDKEGYFNEFAGRVAKSKDENEFMSYTSKLIIDFLVTKTIYESLPNLISLVTKYSFNSQSDFCNGYYQIKISDIVNNLDNCIENKMIPFDKDESVKKLQMQFKNRVINSEEVQTLNNLGKRIISGLFYEFYSNPKILPDSTILRFAEECSDAKKMISDQDLESVLSESSDYEAKSKASSGIIRSEIKSILDEPRNENILARIIADHIAGMTDNYALQKHKEIYGSDFLL